MTDLPPWLTARLACPVDGSSLRARDDSFVCGAGHSYAVRDGIPILLREDVAHTHEAALHALYGEAEPEHYKDTRSAVDPFVQDAIGATGGYLYAGLVGKLTEYPIPELRLPYGHDQTFLDIGCSWGRWSIAAARRGYKAVGIDPSLTGVLAARRVATQLGVDVYYLVADARHLPFASGTFDAVFSYSVIQHFSKADAKATVAEIGRLLVGGGRSLIQLPNAFGLRSMYHQLRRRLREPRLFEVRYWTIPELRRTFQSLIGPSEISIDGFFSLNPQLADASLLPWSGRAVVFASEALRRLAYVVPIMKYGADSLYITSRRVR